MMDSTWDKNGIARADFKKMMRESGEQTASPSRAFRENANCAWTSSDSEDDQATHTPYRDSARRETRDDPVNTRRRQEGQSVLTQLAIENASSVDYQQQECTDYTVVDPTVMEEGAPDKMIEHTHGMNDTVEMASAGEEVEDFGKIPGHEIQPFSPPDRRPAPVVVIIEGSEESGDDQTNRVENRGEGDGDSDVLEISQHLEEEDVEEAEEAGEMKISASNISGGMGNGENSGGASSHMEDPGEIEYALEEMADDRAPHEIRDEAENRAREEQEIAGDGGKGINSEDYPEDENAIDRRAKAPPESKE